ncbi:MAG TPA: hypothetical protein VI197_33465, partial [Polyangiaceae bacterium]
MAFEPWTRDQQVFGNRAVLENRTGASAAAPLPTRASAGTRAEQARRGDPDAEEAARSSAHAETGTGGSSPLVAQSEAPAP